MTTPPIAMTTLAAATLLACGSTASGPTRQSPPPAVADPPEAAEAAPAAAPEPVVAEVTEEQAPPPPIRRAPKPCVSRAGPGEVRTLDLDSDGSADVWEVTRGGIRFCRETDLNFDGRPDLVTFFDSSGRAETRREMDLDFDGVPDVIEVRTGGVVHRVTVETSASGP